MSKKQIAVLVLKSFWMVIPLVIVVGVNDFILHWAAFRMILVYIVFGLLAGLIGFLGPFRRYRPISAGIYLIILLIMLAIVYYWPSTEAENGGGNLSTILTLTFIGWYGLPRYSMLLEQIQQSNDPQLPLNLHSDEPT